MKFLLGRGLGCCIYIRFDTEDRFFGVCRLMHSPCDGLIADVAEEGESSPFTNNAHYLFALFCLERQVQRNPEYLL